MMAASTVLRVFIKYQLSPVKWVEPGRMILEESLVATGGLEPTPYNQPTGRILRLSQGISVS